MCHRMAIVSINNDLAQTSILETTNKDNQTVDLLGMSHCA